MRTDVGTFVFRLPSPASGAKITVEYAESSEAMVFHLLHHPPNRQATIQLSGHLLEIEADEKLVRKVWQKENDNQVAKRWERDRRCVQCDQDRPYFAHVCSIDCVRERSATAVAIAQDERIRRMSREEAE